MISNNNQTNNIGIYATVFGVVGSIASIWSLILWYLNKQPWYVFAIGVSALILFILLIVSVIIYRRHNKNNEEYIASCLDNDYFRNYWTESFYIPMNVQEEDPIENLDTTRLSLEDCFVKRFFQRKVISDTKYACILGDSGSGKSAAMVHLLIGYVKKYTFKTRPYDIKIYSMSMENAELWEKIGSIKEKERCILLLDAMDENIDVQRIIETPNVTPESYLQELAKKTRDFARVVISCRQQFFHSKGEEPKDTLIRINNGKEPYQHWKKYYLSPFNKKQIKAYLRNSLGSSIERERARKMIEKNNDIFHRPLILSNIKDLVAYCEKSQEIKLSTKVIYDIIVLAWLAREPYQKDEREIKLNNLLKMSLCLAAYMYKHNLNVVNNEQYSEFLTEYKEHGINDDDDLFRSRSLLNRTDTGYKYSHKSFYNYFLAYWFFLHPEDIEWLPLDLDITIQYYDDILYALGSMEFTEVDKKLKILEVPTASLACGLRSLANGLSCFGLNEKLKGNAESKYNLALIIYKQLDHEYPNEFLSDIMWTLNNLAIIHNGETAIKEFQEALDIYKKMFKWNPNEYPIDIVLIMDNLARRYIDIGDYSSAAKVFKEAIEISLRLSKEAPEVYQPYLAMIRNDLGQLHRITHDSEAATKEYQEILNIYRNLAENNPSFYLSNVAETLHILANLHREAQEYNTAAKEYQEALDIRCKQVAENPDTTEPLLSTSNSEFIVRSETYYYDSAFKECQEALEFYREHAIKEPDAFLPYVAWTLKSLAGLHRRTHDHDAASKEYKEALEIYGNLSRERIEEFLPLLADTLYDIGCFHVDTQEYEFAFREYKDALEIYRKLDKENSKDYLPSIAMTLNNLGGLYNKTQNYDSAFEANNEALNAYRRLAKDNPGKYLLHVAVSLFNVALFQGIQGLLLQSEEAAIECLDVCSRLDKDESLRFNGVKEMAEHLLDEIHNKMAAKNDSKTET